MSHPPSVPIPLGGTLSVHPPPKVPRLQGKMGSKGKGRRHGERCWFLPAKGPARSGWAGDGGWSPGLATENPSEAADNHNPAAPRAGEQSGWVRVLCAVSHPRNFGNASSSLSPLLISGDRMALLKCKQCSVHLCRHHPRIRCHLKGYSSIFAPKHTLF